MVESNLIKYFLSLSTKGRIKFIITIIPFSVIFITLEFITKAGDIADNIGMEGSWGYKSWLEK